MRSVVRPLVSVATYRRWTFLLGGTALLVPYILIYAGLLQILGDVRHGATRDLLDAALMLAGLVAISSAVAFIPAVRILCRTAAETLLGVRLPEETPEGLRSWRSRRRTAAWWLLHIGVGGGTGFTVVLGLPVILFLLQRPFAGPGPSRRFLGQGLSLAPVWSVPLALAVLLAIIYLGAGVGALFARVAPLLLGPSPADRLARLERQTELLMERNRLARELHDSVGHALTVTTLQAGAAVRLLDTDPEFARRALTAIEETGRTALEDLDHVLGLLREDVSAKTPQRTLSDLGGLFEQTRSAGVEVDAEIGAPRADPAGRLPRGVPDRAGGPDQRAPPCRQGAGHRTPGGPRVPPRTRDDQPGRRDRTGTRGRRARAARHPRACHDPGRPDERRGRRRALAGLRHHPGRVVR